MTDEQLFDIMRPIIMSVTGVPDCILSDQNKPSPDGFYASFNPNTTVNERGQPIFRNKNLPGEKVEYDPRAQIIATSSVNFFGKGSKNAARRLLSANKRPDVSVALYKANVGWNRAGPVNDLSKLQSGNVEERAQINIVLMYELIDPVEINSIETVSVEIQNERADVISSITVDSGKIPNIT